MQSPQKISKSVARSWMPTRPRKSNKGDFGRVFILAGSRGMVGAGVLSAWGALRVGAGLVRLGTVKSQQTVAAKRGPLEMTTDGFAESRSGSLSRSSWKAIKNSIQKFKADVIAVGPGLGASADIRFIVKKLMMETQLPLVLDADGFNAIRRSDAFVRKRKAPWVVTPHPGEMARFFGQSTSSIQKQREKIASQFAKMSRSICLLKGSGTLVTDGTKIYKNPTGNSGMASAGMGDVLTGIIAGLWGQMKDSGPHTELKAATLGAYIHGLAGDQAQKKWTKHGLLASDLAQAVPLAIKTIYRRN